MQAKIKKLLLSSTSKGTAVLGIGNIISALLAVIFTIIVARNLGPETWGAVAVAFGLAAITQAIFDLGLGSAIFKFNANANIIQLQKLFSLRFYTALFAAILALLFGKILTSKLLPQLDFELALYGMFAGVVYLFFDFLVTWQQASRNYLRSSHYLISNNFLRICLVLLIIYWQGLTGQSAVLVYLLSPLVITLFVLGSNYQLFRLTLSPLNYLKEIISFSAPLGINRIISVLSGKIDTLLVFSLLTSYQTGIYSAATQLAFGVPLLIGSLATVIAYRYTNYQGKMLKDYFVKTIYLSVFLSLGLGLGALISPLAIKPFGSEYVESGWVLRYLLLATVPFVLSTPAVNMLIYAYGKTKIVAINSFVMLLIVLVGNYSLIPFWGIHGAIVTLLVSYIFLFFSSYIFTLKYLHK